MRIGRPTPGMAKPTTGGPQDGAQPDEGLPTRGVEDASGGDVEALGGINGAAGRAAGLGGLDEAKGVEALSDGPDAPTTGGPADPFQKIDAAHSAAAADMERGISAQGSAGAVAADEVANLASEQRFGDSPNLAKGLDNAAPADKSQAWDFDPMDHVKMPGEEEDEEIVFSDQVVDEANLILGVAERQIAGEARAAQKVGAAKSGTGAGGSGNNGGGRGSGGGGGRRG